MWGQLALLQAVPLLWLLVAVARGLWSQCKSQICTNLGLQLLDDLVIL